jgi:nitroimidazol reductase NimA-like FMN-containing flavoprotein (pyridoxamine 5'-phosphate oxidase superfamily)
MQEQLKAKALAILDGNRLTSIATLRPDGWPQTTTVGYANDGLVLYFICARDSQKAANIARDDRVSLTVDRDVDDPMAIEGLSMAARARFVDDPATLARAIELLLAKYPEYRAMPAPDLGRMRLVRLEPEVISVLDYSKGFGHADTVHVTPRDLH